jgi:DNA-binding MarR family transcriptional regulator
MMRPKILYVIMESGKKVQTGNDLKRSSMPAKFTFSNTIMKTWMLIHRSENMQKKAQKLLLDREGLTIQTHSILMALDNLPQPVKVSDVANWLDRNPNAISMRIDNMEKEELVTRVRDEHDHRAVSLVMTPKGKQLFDRANKQAWKLFQEFFVDLSEDELKTLCDLLERVRLKAFNIVNPGKTIGEVQTLSERKAQAARDEINPSFEISTDDE